MSANSQINIVDEIKSRCNIVDVIGRVVTLKRSGSNYKGLCPFHNEKTPSFVVSETKQIFTCFGCGAAGDVLEFVEKYYNLDFRGAVEMLAKEYGISLDGAFRSNKDNEELYEINRLAARFFFKALRARENPGYRYMKDRGISEDTLNKFGIGYADGSWDSLYAHLKDNGVPDDKMLELGLVSRKNSGCYDKFRDRVIFPIIDTRGKVIGFGGRIIGEGEPKYLNSQESNIFKKKYNLYGLNLAGSEIRKNDSIILVEGYMDVVSLYQGGVRNVSASLGTALTENQARLIKRYTKNVVLSYDADQAGRSAALRGSDILYAENCAVRVLSVSDGKDPDEFIKKNGRKAFLDLVDRAMPYGDFKLSCLRSGYDMEDDLQRVGYVEAAIGALRGMKPVEADIYIRRLSDETGVSEAAIRAQYNDSGGAEHDRVPHADAAARRSEAAEDMPLVEKDLLKLMLLDASFADLPDDIRNEAFRTVSGMNIYESIQNLRDGKTVDAAKVKEALGERDAERLADIEEKIIPAGKEREIYEDCVGKIRREKLRKRERELVAMISAVDEDGDGDEADELMKQLIRIQKELKG